MGIWKVMIYTAQFVVSLAQQAPSRVQNVDLHSVDQNGNSHLGQI